MAQDQRRLLCQILKSPLTTAKRPNLTAMNPMSCWNLFTLWLVCLNVFLSQSLQNFCPGDEADRIPSHAIESKWHGWSCRRHTMSYHGMLDDLNSIDFSAIEAANKTTLYVASNICDDYMMHCDN